MDQENEQKAAASEKEPTIKADKTWLSPYLLLMLKNWNSHGYELMQKLMFFGFAPIDQATVYRTLRQLEKDGLVVSHWEHAVKGPAKRLYGLTDAGELFLQSCAATMGQYQKMLDQFFRLYTGTSPQKSEHDEEE
ncbi:MAG TPA: poly-beta-hydroxybutyrate-responsive repressor [Bacillota bacterium]|nr:poly-beta-hydroxybutyrate-responsive repressor [Bacillota bacterium]